MGTLGGLLQDRDAQRFVGRQAELEAMTELFSPGGAVRVVHVHGPGGIGKSALLREVARRGSNAGWVPRRIDGRELEPTRAALAEALLEIETEPRPLLLIDTYELISGLDGLLRRETLRALPGEARVVFASRRPPDPGWSQDGWETVTRTLGVGPLNESDARALLRTRGVPEADHPVLLRSAAGSPLALGLLASTGAGDSAATPVPSTTSAGAAPEAQIRDLIGRLTGSELDAAHRDVLAVAALARVTSRALLADVLPHHDPDQALAWLASRSFAEPLWGGVTLHDLVRRAARSDIRQRDPEREGALRRAIADHLHARALTGDVMVSIDLAHLVENPLVRWGWSWDGGDRYLADGLRPGDLDQLAALYAAHERAGPLWPITEALLVAAPARAAVVRSVEDQIVGLTVALTPDTAPPVAWEHPHTGPWLTHARDELLTGNAVIWQSSIVLDPTADPIVQAMLGMVGILRSGLRNPRYSYLPISPQLPGARDFAAAVGARHIPQLDFASPEGTLECHLLDHGPTGVLGMQRDSIYRETGMAPPATSADVAEAVRQALRHLHRPDELARCPLARGDGGAARAESVRQTLEQAVDETFGAGPDEQLLREVIIRGYFEPGMTHERAADLLHVSRATYFRKLRVASQRISEHVATQA
jgi:hypothetical protein